MRVLDIALIVIGAMLRISPLLLYVGVGAVLNAAVSAACWHPNCTHGWYSQYNGAEKGLFILWAVGAPLLAWSVAKSRWGAATIAALGAGINHLDRSALARQDARNWARYEKMYDGEKRVKAYLSKLNKNPRVCLKCQRPMEAQFTTTRRWPGFKAYWWCSNSSCMAAGTAPLAIPLSAKGRGTLRGLSWNEKGGPGILLKITLAWAVIAALASILGQ